MDRMILATIRLNDGTELIRVFMDEAEFREWYSSRKRHVAGFNIRPAVEDNSTRTAAENDRTGQPDRNNCAGMPDRNNSTGQPDRNDRTAAIRKGAIPA